MRSLCLPLNREIFSLKFHEYKNSFYRFFFSVKPEAAYCQTVTMESFFYTCLYYFVSSFFSPSDVFIVTGKLINHTIITYYKIQHLLKIF